ncbi:PspC domain-containing protein [Candidatus Uabimicrobium sp. HlEnr_7]|uniref:PspC domain-containing protein n=1 Tax=Candidatus Uabimicrobium helgolandensis TaxID=3095367 RepID=UPI0035582ABD
MNQNLCLKCGKKTQFNHCSSCGTTDIIWYRIKEGRKIFGVCQGLAVYIHLPVIAIRIAFIIAAMFAGWGVVLYAVLSFFPSRNCNDSVRQKESFEFEDSEKLSFFESSVKTLHKFLSFIFFVVLCACLYFPLFMISAIATIVSVVGWFYPYLTVGIHHSTFLELGMIGFFAGFTNITFGITTIYLIAHWILAHHIKKPYLPLSRTIILWFIVCAACLSSLWMLKSLERSKKQKSWVITTEKNIEEILTTENISIRNISFSTHKGNETRVVYTLQVYGFSKKLLTALAQVNMIWNGEPLWSNLGSTQPFFPHFDITVQMPESKSLNIRDFESVYVSGKWNKIQLENHKSIVIENATIGTVKSDCNYCEVRVENVSIETSYLYFNKSDVLMDSFTVKNANFYQNSGSLTLVDFSGKLQLQVVNSRLKIIRPTFENTNRITADNSKVLIDFSSDFIPIIVYDKLNVSQRLESTMSSRLEISGENSTVKLRK